MLSKYHVYRLMKYEHKFVQDLGKSSPETLNSYKDRYLKYVSPGAVKVTLIY